MRMSRRETGMDDFIIGATRYMCVVRLVGCSFGWRQDGSSDIVVGGIGV